MPRGVYPRVPGAPRKVFIDYDRLREMVECGYTRAEAAAEFGCCGAWMWRKAKEVGLRFRRGNREDSQIRIDIINLVTDGCIDCQSITEARGKTRGATYRVVEQLVVEGVLLSSGKGPHRKLSVASWWRDR